MRIANINDDDCEQAEEAEESQGHLAWSGAWHHSFTFRLRSKKHLANHVMCFPSVTIVDH